MRGMGRGWGSSLTRSASLASLDFGRSVLSFLLHVWNHYDDPFTLSEVADWADQHQIAYRGPSGAIGGQMPTAHGVLSQFEMTT